MLPNSTDSVQSDDQESIYSPDGEAIWPFASEEEAEQSDRFLMALPPGDQRIYHDSRSDDDEREQAFQRGVKYAIDSLQIEKIWSIYSDYGSQRSKVKTDALIHFAKTGERPRDRQLEIDFWRGAHHTAVAIGESWWTAEESDRYSDEDFRNVWRQWNTAPHSSPSRHIKTVERFFSNMPERRIERCIEEAPGFLKSYIDHHAKTAHRKQPRFALAGGLTLVGVLAGRKYRDCQDTRTNFYNVCIGPAASGKDHSRKLNVSILTEAGASSLLGNDEATSDSAIGRMLSVHPARLMQTDEIGRFLASADPGRNPHLYKLVTMLQKLWTDAISRHWQPTGYADLSRNYQVDQPHLCMLGTTTPEVFYASLGGSAIDDGMLSRVNIFVGDMVKRSKPVLQKPPAELTDFAKRLFEWWPPTGNMSAEHPEPQVIESTDAAEAIYDDYAERCDELAEKQPAFASLHGRAYQKARQFGLAYAIADSSVEIDTAAADWGVNLAAALTAELCEIAESRLARSQFEKDCQEMLRAIRSAKGGIIAKRDLCRSLRRLKAKEQADCLAALEQQELIGQGSAPNEKAGRPKLVVFCAERNPDLWEKLEGIKAESRRAKAAGNDIIPRD